MLNDSHAFIMNLSYIPEEAGEIERADWLVCLGYGLAWQWKINRCESVVGIVEETWR